MKKEITYGIYIYEQVAELDFVAPLQVFAASNQFAGGGRVVTLSGSNQPLCGLSGLRITPDYSLEEAPALDVLLLPGTAEVSEYAWRDPNILDWVRQQYEKVEYMTAVCTGGLILQKAGLLKGRKATTLWQLMEAFTNCSQIMAQPEAHAPAVLVQHLAVPCGHGAVCPR